MLQTLFTIPHEIGGVPIFGFGWGLLFWLILSGVFLLLLARRFGWSGETLGYIPIILIVAAVIVFLAPHVETRVDGQPIGIELRGYGLMMLLASVAAVGLAVYRARRMGLDIEIILSLTFVMFISGLIGARTFHVVQYWYLLHVPGDFAATVANIFSVTKGGLVVYGSVLAALPAGAIYLLWRKQPLLAVADLVAPSLVLGLAIGRIGCLLNGCCYGGLCEAPWQPGIQFPVSSPAYMQQIEDGTLLEMEVTPEEGGRNREMRDDMTVTRVRPGGRADKAGIAEGDRLLRGAAFGDGTDPIALRRAKEDERRKNDVALWGGGGPSIGAKTQGLPLEAEVAAGVSEIKQPVRVADLPAWSRPVHPAQIYSAVSAGLLCLFLWHLYPFRRRDGEIFALLAIVYPITRITLEFIRTDEGGQFGTSFTISQWVSAGILLGGVALMIALQRRPRQTALPPACATG